MIAWLQSGVMVVIDVMERIPRSSRTVPARVARSRDKRLFKKLFPDHISQDPFGSTSHDGVYKDVCLVHSLQALGVPLEVNCSGPFRATEHGNAMLRPLGLTLVRTLNPYLGRGKFVKWQSGHFSADIIADQVTVMERDRSLTYRSIHDIGRPDQIKWWRLTDLSDCSDASLALPIEVQNRIDHHWAAAMRRRATSACSSASGVAPALGHQLSAQQVELIRRNREAAIRRRTSALVRPLPPLGWVHPAAPTEPADWVGWQRQLPDVTFLSCLNAHARDRALRFYPDTHAYLIRGGAEPRIRYRPHPFLQSGLYRR